VPLPKRNVQVHDPTNDKYPSTIRVVPSGVGAPQYMWVPFHLLSYLPYKEDLKIPSTSRSLSPSLSNLLCHHRHIHSRSNLHYLKLFSSTYTYTQSFKMKMRPFAYAFLVILSWVAAAQAVCSNNLLIDDHANFDSRRNSLGQVTGGMVYYSLSKASSKQVSRW
jgi:hypothetical protein